MEFDIRNFCKVMNGNGRAFQYQAIELIKICRTFSILEQSPCQVDGLQSVLKACDAALYQAARLRKGPREHIDHKFDEAIRELHEYERKFHANNRPGTSNQPVMTRMETAKKEDVKKRRKDRISVKDSRVVCFHIQRSLLDLDRNPIIVKQALSSTSEVPDILWNFSHFEGERRLTLTQNPHFYEDLPTNPTTFWAEFKIQPTNDYRDTIFVLTNNERRVFLEFGKKLRTFDNVWKTSDALILKDVIGKVESENIVGKTIPALPLSWSRLEHPEFQPQAFEEIEHWTDPIHDLWDSPRTRIHIRPSGH